MRRARGRETNEGHRVLQGARWSLQRPEIEPDELLEEELAIGR